jgi:2-polyprenyl-3-methyl-5-hydroxy-6-metoxy-1,4-benzoquinol methylase
MTTDDQTRWDKKYAARESPDEINPDAWLVESLRRVDPSRALELACGLSHNAVWLASQGWEVDAVDISPVGLQLAEEFASKSGQRVNWIAADLDTYEIEPQAYDLILVFRFLDRTQLPPQIENGLRSGGHLVYETFTIAQLSRADNHLRNASFMLQPDELPTLFPNLTRLAYGEVELHDRSVAQLLARRPQRES